MSEVLRQERPAPSSRSGPPRFAIMLTAGLHLFVPALAAVPPPLLLGVLALCGLCLAFERLQVTGYRLQHGL